MGISAQKGQRKGVLSVSPLMLSTSRLHLSPNLCWSEKRFKLSDFGNVRAAGEFQLGDKSARRYTAAEVSLRI
jgi:hypothetical protein